MNDKANSERKREAFAIHILCATPVKYRKYAYQQIKPFGWIKNVKLAEKIVRGYTPDRFREN